MFIWKIFLAKDAHLDGWRGLDGVYSQVNAVGKLEDSVVDRLLVCLEAAAQGLNLLQLALQVPNKNKNIT